MTPILQQAGGLGYLDPNSWASYEKRSFLDDYFLGPNYDNVAQLAADNPFKDSLNTFTE